MDNIIDSQYADKLAKARRRHGKVFKANTHVARQTEPSLLLTELMRQSDRKKTPAGKTDPKQQASAAQPRAVVKIARAT